MKPKTLILMVVAVSCGLGASYMTSRLLADRGDNVEKVTILIAKKNLNMGESLKSPDEMFEPKALPRGDEPRMAISDSEKLKGRVLRRALRAGDFVTPEDLLDEKSGVGSISANLPPGHVAVGIRVSPESIAGGFASLPNSRVNIMLTVRRGDDKGSYSKILLEKVLVLAADTQTVRTESGGAMPANVVTVALKFEDSLRLELAKQTGTISLALRNINDSSLATNSKLTVEGLMGNVSDPASLSTENSEPQGPSPLANIPVTPKEAPPPAPVVAKETPAKASPYTIIIREGTKIRNAVVESEETQPPTTPRVEGTEPAPQPPAPAVLKNDKKPTDGD